MNLLAWSYRGLRLKKKINSVRNLVHKFDPSCLFLMETKVDQERMEKLGRSLGFSFVLAIGATDNDGGLALFAKEDLEVELIIHVGCTLIFKVFSLDGKGYWFLILSHGTPYQ